VKALSIRQPWAWAILHAGKRVENRDWRGCDYRGPVLLHASKSVGTRADFDDACWGIADEAGVDPSDGPHAIADLGACPTYTPRASMDRVGIVGRARIDGVIRSADDLAHYGRDRAEYDRAQFWREEQAAWHTGGFALVLADVEPLPFVPWRGALGLFEVPDDYAAQAATEVRR